MEKVAIVQFDDRPDELIGPLRGLLFRNALYAKQRGYYYELSRRLEADVPSYWNKVFLVERLLRSGFEMVAWLDTDAVIHDLDISVESMFVNEARFVFAPDPPIWKTASPINAGVFFCKGNFGAKLMKEWQGLYPSALWRKRDGKWNFEEQLWAGPAYEQGAFAATLLPKYAQNPAFRQVSWNTLQSPYPQQKSFTLHFPNKLRTNCLLYLQQPIELEAG